MHSAFSLKPVVLALLLLFVSGIVVRSAQADGDNDKKPAVEEPTYSATSLRATLLYQEQEGDVALVQVAIGSRRSAPLAFGMSAVVPGLGQAYNKQWIKAVIAIAAEAALITGYTVWQGRGVDGRDAYRAYAHEGWSPTQYARWLNDYKVWLESDFGATISSPNITIPPDVEGIDLSNASGWTSAQRTAIRSLFDQIRAMESNVFHPETGASFSHKLPYFGEQQYYELIGKYFQFAPGWSDYQFLLDAEGNPTWIDAQGNFVEFIDPEETGPDGSKVNASPQFFDYSKDHGKANDYLRRASRLSVLFIANHFLAAVDAALFAKLHNDRLKTSVNLTYNQFGEPEPVATLSFTF